MKKKNKSKLGSIIGIIVAILFVGLVIYAFAKDEMASDYIKEVNYQELQEIINKDEKSIIFVGRNDCGHCLSYKPIVEKVAKNNNLKVYYINTNKVAEESKENSEALWTFFDTDATPTTAIVGSGKLIAREIGSLKEQQLLAFLKANYF